MAPKSVTFRRHDHLVSVLFGDLLSHSYNITFSMFLDLVLYGLPRIVRRIKLRADTAWCDGQFSVCKPFLLTEAFPANL